MGKITVFKKVATFVIVEIQGYSIFFVCNYYGYKDK